MKTNFSQEIKVEKLRFHEESGVFQVLRNQIFTLVKAKKTCVFFEALDELSAKSHFRRFMGWGLFTRVKHVGTIQIVHVIIEIMKGNLRKFILIIYEEVVMNLL